MSCACCLFCLVQDDVCAMQPIQMLASFVWAQSSSARFSNSYFTMSVWRTQEIGEVQASCVCAMTDDAASDRRGKIRVRHASAMFSRIYVDSANGDGLGWGGGVGLRASLTRPPFLLKLNTAETAETTHFSTLLSEHCKANVLSMSSLHKENEHQQESC